MAVYRSICLSLLLTLTGSYALGQEMLGFVNSNYSGSQGVSVNPSYMANSKLRADISLFTFNSFVDNNYFYLPAGEASFFSVITGKYEFPYFDKPYGRGERNVHSYYLDPADKDFYVNTRLNGPSVMFGLNDHFISVHTSYRMVGSMRRVPYDIANFSYYAMDYYPQHNIYYERSNYNMAAMGWWEMGISYATVLARPFHTLWSAGITVNFMAGYSGAYVNGNQTNYIVYNDSIINVDYLDAELGFSLPMDYQTNEVDLFHNLIRGTGMGVDIGINFQYRDKPYLRKYAGMYYQKKFEDYRYRVGLAVLDIGYIDFRTHAERHSYDGVSNHHINVESLEYTNINDELNSVSFLFYGDPEASLRGNSFRIYLPTSVSLQFDYNAEGPWFINATLIARLPVFKPMIERPTVLALTPRYETRELEVSLPMIFYDFYSPRLGLAVRYRGFTIGSDNIGGFLGYIDMTGYDIYINYKINLTGPKKLYYSKKNPCWYNQTNY
jgi:hypothetical protein